MYKLLFTSTVLFFLVHSAFSQKKTHHFSNSTFESKANRIKTYLNDDYYVVMTENHLQPGQVQHELRVVDLKRRDVIQVVFEGENKLTPKLFGFHLEQASFSFLEENYSDIQKVHSLTLHTYLIGKKSWSSKRIFKERSDQPKRQYKFVRTMADKVPILYLLQEDKQANAQASVLIFDADFNLTSRRDYKFNESINLSFDWTLISNNSGDILAVQQVLDSREGNYLACHYVNVLQESDDENVLKPIYKIRNAYIQEYKVTMKDDGIVDFIGLMDQVIGRIGGTTEILVRRFHPLKATDVFNQQFVLKKNNGYLIHSYLPLNEEYSAMIVQEVNSRANAKPNENARTSAELPAQSKGAFIVMYLHNQKGVVWQEQLTDGSDHSNVMFTRLYPNIFEPYFWSDGSNLYALYNTSLKTSNAGQISQSGIKTNNSTSQQPDALVSKLKQFDLSNGHSRWIDLLERDHKTLLFPLSSKLTQLDYLMSLVQVEPNKFYPVHIYLK